MDGKIKKLRDIDRELEEMADNPKNATVADYHKLAMERSALLYKIETEQNLNSGTQKVREIRESIAKIVNEKN